MKEICGLKCSVSVGYLDPDTFLPKTCQASLLQDTSAELLQTFPKHGMTSNGVLSELTIPAHLTGGRDSGYWRTPHASDGEGGIMKMHKDKAGHYKLRDHVQEVNREMWPTPRASEWKGTGPKGSKSQKYRLEKGYLDATVEELHGGTQTRQTYQTPTREDYRRRGPNSRQQGLPEQIHKQTYPTPRGGGKTGDVGMCGGTGAFQKIQSLDVPEEEKKAMSQGNGGQLNPAWVCWLMGWPVNWVNLEPLSREEFQGWLRASGIESAS